MWPSAQLARPRIARTMLFSLALLASPYLPLGLANPQDNGALLTIAYFYPALIVLWGLWKAHSVIGWAVMGIHGANTAVFIGIAAILEKPFKDPSTESSILSAYYWQNIAMIPVSIAGLHFLFNFWTLVIFVFFWRWDCHLPPPMETKRDNRAIPDHGQNPIWHHNRLHALLLAILIACVCLGCLLTIWLALIFLGNGEEAHSRLVMGAHWLTWPQSILETPHAVFHMVSITVLGLSLLLGMVCRRNDMVEAACWLLLPGQLITVTLLPVPLLAVVSTLAMLILGLLIQWRHGFPMTLLQTRRHRTPRDWPDAISTGP